MAPDCRSTTLLRSRARFAACTQPGDRRPLAPLALRRVTPGRARFAACTQPGELPALAPLAHALIAALAGSLRCVHAARGPSSARSAGAPPRDSGAGLRRRFAALLA